MATVTLKLTVGSVTVEVTGEQEFAEKKFQELVTQYLSPAKPRAVSEGKATPLPIESGGKKLAPGEFLKKVGAKNGPDRAMALGYYLEHVEQMPSFTTGDLNDKAREAKSPFGNVSDVVYKLASRGLMMSAGDREGARAYSLTASGEEYVRPAHVRC